jgi:drug/metabolite transporter (DMT)-like permease
MIALPMSHSSAIRLPDVSDSAASSPRGSRSTAQETHQKRVTGETHSLDSLGVATILTLSVVWGFNPIVFKTALAEVGPQSLSGIRCAIGCLCVIVYARVMKRAIFRVDGTEALGILLGLIYVAQHFALFESLRWTTLSHSAVFFYVAPLLIAFGTTFLFRNERFGLLQWIGLSLAFLGVVSEFSRRWGVSHPAGDAMALLAALLWAASTLLIKGTQLSRIEPVKTVFYQIATAAIICPIAAWALGESAPTGLSVSTYAALIWQGAGIVGITYVLWIWLLGRYSAAQLSAFGFVTPLTGVAVATLLVDEPLTDNLIVAVALVIAGLVLVGWPRRRVVSPWLVCGSTARSPLRSCISLATAAFSGTRALASSVRVMAGLLKAAAALVGGLLWCNHRSRRSNHPFATPSDNDRSLRIVFVLSGLRARREATPLQLRMPSSTARADTASTRTGSRPR